MTLQTGGQISINDVAGEYSVTGNNRSLTSLSTGAGLTAPHGLKEFYGLSDTIEVNGIAFVVGSFSSSQQVDTYQTRTAYLPTGETATLQFNYTRTGSSNSGHSLTLFKNGTAVHTFQSSTGTSLQTKQIDVVLNDTLGVSATNTSNGTTHTANILWANMSDNGVTLASDTLNSTYSVSTGGGGGSGGGGSGGTCFTGDMAVTMSDNSLKFIRDISVGDTVLSSTGDASEVLDVWVNDLEVRTIYNINSSLKVTGGHPIKTTAGWSAIDTEKAKQLHPEMDFVPLTTGSTLVKQNDVEEAVETIVSSVEEVVVYNLNVSGDDTYYVQGILVHNK